MYKFVFNKEQQVKFHEWDEAHKKRCVNGDPMNQGAIGGRLTFSFTPTSLGEIQKVRCVCGEEIDLTDYDW